MRFPLAAFAFALCAAGCGPALRYGTFPGDREFQTGEEIVGWRESGIASYYGRKYHGRTTANGETFDMHGITAAHRTLPFQTWVRVTRRDDGASLDVRINDRGPFIAGRIIDLSQGAAQALDMIREGVIQVEIQVISAPW